MEAQNHASDESVSSGPCMDFQLNFNNFPNNHETTSANSSNVGLGLGLGLGAVHSEQHSCHQIYQNTHPNNADLGNFSTLQDLSLSLNLSSTNPHRINSTHHPTLFPYQNWAATSTPNTTRLQAPSHNPMPFRLQLPPTNVPTAPKFNPMIKKRARDDALLTHCTTRESSSQPSSLFTKRARDDALLTHCTTRESSSQPSSLFTKGGGIGNYGRMKNGSTHVPPLIALKKNPLDGRSTNSVYDIMFEEVGLPMDPHLRLFFPL